MSWDALIEPLVAEMRAKELRPIEANRRVRAVKHFLRWVEAQKLEPLSLTLDDVPKLLEQFIEAAPIRKQEPRTKEEELHRSFASAAFMRVLEEQGDKSAAPAEVPPKEAKTEENTDMGARTPNVEADIIDPDELEQDELGPDDTEDVDEVPPSRRKAPAARVQPVMVMQMPAPKRRPLGGAPVQSAAVKRLLPRSEKLRVYKRDGGRRAFIGDYLTDDVGGSLHAFIKDYVDPEVGDPSGRTEYEVVEVDPSGRDRGQPASVVIETGRSQLPSNDPIDQVRSVAQLLQDLKEEGREQTEEQQALLLEAKKKALAGEGVNMNQLMMLMMMEKMMGPRDDNTLLKAVELLRKPSGPMGMGGPQGFNGAPEFGPGHSPASPPPWWMMPPPPPPPPPQNHALDKVVEVAIAKLAAPPPEPKSLAEQMKELMLFKELLGGGGEVASLRAELTAMRAELSKPREVGGIDAALGTFERLSGVVQTLAPKLNMGGITGALQNILTPQLGQALGNMLASGIDKGKQVPSAAAPAQLPAGQVQQPQSAPAPAPADPNAIPPAVVNAVKAVQVAQTREAQVQAMTALLEAMYSSNVPRFTQPLETALQALLQSKLDPARLLTFGILHDVRKELATPPFVDACIAALIAKAGATPPEELVKNAGKWTFTQDGKAIVPTPDAVPIEVVKEPTPTANAEEVAKAQVEAKTNEAKANESSTPSNGVAQAEAATVTPSPSTTIVEATPTA